MTAKNILYAVLLNGFMLLIILLIVFLIKKNEAMTAKHLQRIISKKIDIAKENPFKDDFCKTRMMLAVLENKVPHERTLASILLYWTQKNYINLEITPKKRLQSFGDANQETIIFCCENPKLQGAEKLLFETLYSFADETLTIQKSELYQISRKQYDIIFQRIEQFISQGKYALLSSGEMYKEKKSQRFGFLNEQRYLFTQKGIRKASQLKGYQLWLKQQTQLDENFWRDAVLLNSYECIKNNKNLSIAISIANNIILGANSGKQSNIKKTLS